MGAIINHEEEDRAILHIHNLPAVAKEALSHHFRNALTEVMNGITLNDIEIVKSGTKHILFDLERFGL